MSKQLVKNKIASHPPRSDQMSNVRQHENAKFHKDNDKDKDNKDKDNKDKDNRDKDKDKEKKKKTTRTTRPEQNRPD